ncbi:MAG TPA: LysM peptidoglycan-binding domain-containing protein [Flavipsychrobacter sp.]|nr:LysM peptidoglycan-binding domain-containing protein [Flavipsychrobacter sp.]
MSTTNPAGSGLQTKYQSVIDYARESGVADLQVREQNNVLYVDGTAPSESVKKEIWTRYEQADPEMRSGDMVLNMQVAAGAASEYEVKSGDSLSRIAQNYEGISWQDIFEANRDQIQDPDKIFPGQVLKIPTA